MPLQNSISIDSRSWYDRIDIGPLIVLLRPELTNEGLIESQVAGHRDHVDDVRSLALRSIAIEVVAKDRVTGLVPIGLIVRPAGATARVDIDIWYLLTRKSVRSTDFSLWQLVTSIRIMTRVAFFEIVKV